VSFKAEYKDSNKLNYSAKKSSRPHNAGNISHNLNNNISYDHNYAPIHAAKPIGNQVLQSLTHSDSKFNFNSIPIHSIQSKSNVSNPTSLGFRHTNSTTDMNANMNTTIPTSSHSSQQKMPNIDSRRLLEKQIKSCKIKNPPSLAKVVNPTVIEEKDKTGSNMMEKQSTDIESENANLREEYNEFGFLDGEQLSNVHPYNFIDGGKTGSAIVHWAGGGGGRGNQGVGDITLVAPVIEGKDAPKPGDKAEAWIRPGTGTATVTRSFTGVLTGANGPDRYFTAAAAARADRHERLHIASSKGIHDTNIVPLERRIDKHRPWSTLPLVGNIWGTSNSLKAGSLAADAIAALTTFIDWNTAITNFRTADTAANIPGGTVDTTDSAQPDFIKDKGFRTVAGHGYAHYFDI
jgi:hypothetical protein